MAMKIFQMFLWKKNGNPTRDVASMKPYRGMIEDWFIHEFDKDEAKKLYPDEDLGLGYMICGRLMQLSPWPGGHTSWVVKRNGNEIETRNSRYTLGKPLDRNT